MTDIPFVRVDRVLPRPTDLMPGGDRDVQNLTSEPLALGSLIIAAGDTITINLDEFDDTPVGPNRRGSPREIVWQGIVGAYLYGGAPRVALPGWDPADLPNVTQDPYLDGPSTEDPQGAFGLQNYNSNIAPEIAGSYTNIDGQLVTIDFQAYLETVPEPGDFVLVFDPNGGAAVNPTVNTVTRLDATRVGLSLNVAIDPTGVELLTISCPVVLNKSNTAAIGEFQFTMGPTIIPPP